MKIKNSRNPIFLLTFAALLLVACARQVTPSAAPTAGQATPSLVSGGVPTIEPTLATLQLAVYPPEARTGITALDVIIDAVLAHDFETLHELTLPAVIECTHADGLGGPPKCGPAETEGTPVEVVPFLGAEGHHQRWADYLQWSGPDVRGLLAAYRVSPDVYSEAAYPAGEYALVFLDADGATDITLQIDQGQVLRYDYGYSGTLQSDLERQAAEMILPLTIRPIPTAMSWNQFTDPQGRFTFLYPPAMSITPVVAGDKWRIGEQIEVAVLPVASSWITCFDQALGDCPFVESDTPVTIQGHEARRVKGYIGSVGGRIPQEFLVYIFELDDEAEALTLTLYALPFDTTIEEPTTIWPLEGPELELFERTVETVLITD